MKHAMLLSDKSVEKAGITKDPVEAVCEYIWNGLEAGATSLIVELLGDDIGEARALQISDNGTGINYDKIADYFGNFLVTQKDGENIRVKSQKNKGKGRFAFKAFAKTAQWNTTYFDPEKGMLNYTITIDGAEKKDYFTTDPQILPNGTTGTTVTIPINDEIILEKITYGKMEQKLLEEFSWFLSLHRRKNLVVKYLDVTLDYSSYIDEAYSKEEELKIDESSFLIDVVVWKNRVDNGSKIYYLAPDGTIRNAENTSFNKNTVEFYHAVIVHSDFFNQLNGLETTDFDEIEYTFIPEEQKTILKKLRSFIKKLIENTLKEFLRSKADFQVKRIYAEKIAPDFPTDPYGQLRKKDFERVTKELYVVEPRIFYQLTPMQEKSLLGFLNLLLSSNERENILDILSAVVDLSADQRSQFATVLRRSKIEYVVEFLELLRKRTDTIAELKRIVFDLTTFANERDHVQRIIEQNYWLFGEEYALITADREMKTSLLEFERVLNTSNTGETSMNPDESKKRLDILLYGVHSKYDGKKECLVVELKAPSVSLTPIVFSQIENYANIIRREPRFLSTERIWKFYVICRTISDDVQAKIRSYADKGKLGLAAVLDNFEIYALNWDDVFTTFDTRHTPLVQKLQSDLNSTYTSEFAEETPSRDLADRITASLV